ncbi:pancreatic triacylglycerol lipase-like [Megalopta genalis]|uniref:pancreatic triacylglycerol lipase-like n=1 Tax=Megalopta genalis TaxID=115081 RepID=UPI003FCFE98B
MESFRVWLVLGMVSLSLEHVAEGAVDTGTIFFRCYKGASFNDVNIKQIGNLIPQLNLREQTVFHIHGYTENVERESVTIIVRAYLNYTTKNIIAIDYRHIADNNNYIADVVLVNEVGSAIANALHTLVATGLNPNGIHIIGHSLGGQLAASVGSHTNFIVPRITGLDPAGPLYYTGRYLKAGDAAFVDIIHTDEGVLGQIYNSGDVDFLPNAGHRPQPGCSILATLQVPDALCSHHRSWRYYAESVGNPHGFLADPCLNVGLLLCDRSNVVPMGYATPSNARGKYYLYTNSQYPFALGLNGLAQFLPK